MSRLDPEQFAATDPRYWRAVSEYRQSDVGRWAVRIFIVAALAAVYVLILT